MSLLGQYTRTLGIHVSYGTMYYPDTTRCMRKVKKQKNEIHPSLSLFNNILNDLKQEFPFLKKSESTSLQQVLRDLLKAFKCFFNGTSNYPKHKSKKKSKKTFRVQNNNNSVRVVNKKLRVPTLGFIKYKSSNEYTLLLHNF